MTYTTSSAIPELAEQFQNLEVDQQLALFYFIYKEIGHAITPAAPGASTASAPVAEGLFNQVKEMNYEEQLQLQRDLITSQNTLITREYGALSNTTKLLFWYLLAQGMEQSTIIPLPEDYKLTDTADALLNQIKLLEFNQQITLFRDIVSPMGVDPDAAPHDTSTGL
jgi:hypothetical protein